MLFALAVFVVRGSSGLADQVGVELANEIDEATGRS
jgi:hypothetical protein